MRLFLALCAVSAFAADPRIGTWTSVSWHYVFDPNDYLTITAQGKALHVANSGGITTEYTAEFDGKDYPVKNSSNADQVMFRKIDATMFERTFKKDGKVVRVGRYSVSKTGQELKLTQIPESDTARPTFFDRSGGVVNTSNLFIGNWTRNVDKEAMPETFTFQPNGNGVQLIGPQGLGYTAQFDGKQYPAVKSRDETVSVKIVDAYHVEETWMRQGKVADHVVWVISTDGADSTVTDDGVLPDRVLPDGTKIHIEQRFRKQ